MSDWMTSGADAPSLVQRSDRHRSSRGWRRRGDWPAAVLIVAGELALATPAAVMAHDSGRYAATSPDLKAWFDSLRSGRGPCCSDADGSAVSDVDWESSGGHYRVRLDGQWLDVPDDAVITTPNRIGRTMVWPIRGEAGILIRCFMPGSMT